MVKYPKKSKRGEEGSISAHNCRLQSIHPSGEANLKLLVTHTQEENECTHVSNQLTLIQTLHKGAGLLTMGRFLANIVKTSLHGMFIGQANVDRFSLRCSGDPELYQVDN